MMDINTIILDLLEKHGEVKAAQVVEKTRFSRAYVNRFFRKLRDEGRIVLVGKANQARYIPATSAALLSNKKRISTYHRQLKNEALQEDQVLDHLKHSTGIYDKLPANVAHIMDYAFLEMLNNAIEHSRSPRIDLRVEKTALHLHFEVRDYGIGIFNNIMTKKKLASPLEAIQDLLKGKQTTAPAYHSGEGIFFTSRCGDTFLIKSFHEKLRFDNLLDDVFISDGKKLVGSHVSFTIEQGATRQLEDIFSHYSESGFEFDRSEVRLRLYILKSDFLSRSQARRVLSGLQSFSTIVFDFGGVETVGQAFADEVYRVWQKRHPTVRISTINANENIEFMIRRAVEGSRP